MIIYKARKMFGGRVSVRSYYIDYIKRMRMNMVLEFEDRRMIITPKTPYTCDERLHKAERTDKYIKRGEYYKLYDYVFVAKPRPIEQTMEGIRAKFEALGRALGKKPNQEKLI